MYNEKLFLDASYFFKKFNKHKRSQACEMKTGTCLDKFILSLKTPSNA